MLLNRLVTIFFACITLLSACDRDTGITDQLLFKEDPNTPAEAIAPSAIPDWLKEKIWKDQSLLVEQLLALEEGDAEAALDLSNQLVNRQRQDKLYVNWINANGIAIISTYGVGDNALVVARDIVLTMTAKHPEIRQKLHIDNGFYMVLYDRLTYDTGQIPEIQVMLYGNRAPMIIEGICSFDDKVNACIAPHGGNTIFGITIEKQTRYPGRSCRSMGFNTDNRWCYSDGGEVLSWNTFVHEFAHAIHAAIDSASEPLDTTFTSKLKEAYENAVENDLWTVKADRYAKKNFMEYWAVNSEWWFMPRASGSLLYKGELLDIPEISQQTFGALDPKLYALMTKWYPSTEFVTIE